MNLNLENKVAFVCGSTQGIGWASAQQLASMGASIVLVARNEDQLKKNVALLDTSAGQKHSFVTADFNDLAELVSSVKKMVSELGQADILINNTGGPPGGKIADATPDAFLAAFTQHLLANQLITQALLPKLKEGDFGRIINVISTSVKQPIPGLGVSNTIRGAVANWAKTLADEVGPFGITVNNVLPGFTQTSRLTNIIANKANAGGISEEKVAETMKASVPLRRFADPSEVADAICFLASPAGGYISGTNLPVDGGRTKSL